MVYVLAVAAALANALTSIFQRIGVEDAPEDTTLRLSLLAHAIRRGIWLLGFALMVVSFVMQAIALHLGSLTRCSRSSRRSCCSWCSSSWCGSRSRSGSREWVRAVAAAGRPGRLPRSSPPRSRATRPPGRRRGPEVGAPVRSPFVAVRPADPLGPRWWRAAMFGAAAAIGFAFTAALTKVVDRVHRQRLDVACSRTGRPTRSPCAACCRSSSPRTRTTPDPSPPPSPTLVLVDPLASILIGLGLFNDFVRTSEPWGAARGGVAARHVPRGRAPVPVPVGERVEGRGRRMPRNARRPRDARGRARSSSPVLPSDPPDRGPGARRRVQCAAASAPRAAAIADGDDHEPETVNAASTTVGPRPGGPLEPEQARQGSGGDEIGPEVEPHEQRGGVLGPAGGEERGGGQVVDHDARATRQRRRFPRRRAWARRLAGPDQTRPSAPSPTARPNSPTTTGRLSPSAARRPADATLPQAPPMAAALPRPATTSAGGAAREDEHGHDRGRARTREARLPTLGPGRASASGSATRCRAPGGRPRARRS